MTIKDLKYKFHKELDSIYLKEEVESFYYLLLEHRLNLKRIDTALSPNSNIETNHVKYFNSTLEELKKEIPIQYIIGTTEFYGLPFYVNNNVLIPRPETEELVAWIINEVEENKKLKILDIGTGSGCIAISLAKHLPKAEVYAMDISQMALETTRKNAKLNDVEIFYLNEDILKLNKLPVKFDLIVSNPPYVRELEKQEIKANVLDNEPHLALFVKDDNALLFYAKIAKLAKENLNPNGQLFFEINQYLPEETLELLKDNGFQNNILKKDIFGNDRMIKANLNLTVNK